MKDEYDFSKGERGKFYRESVTLTPPVHLDAENLLYLSERAAAQGTTLSALVNRLLRTDIELIGAMK